jgi:hypothetical protein
MAWFMHVVFQEVVLSHLSIITVKMSCQQPFLNPHQNPCHLGLKITKNLMAVLLLSVGLRGSPLTSAPESPLSF